MVQIWSFFIQPCKPGCCDRTPQGVNSFFNNSMYLCMISISLGDIHNLPTLWVLALFGNFYNFCSDVQTCRHLGGGGYVYTF